MPISIKTDLEFGDTWYLKVDPEQLPHILSAIVVMPGKEFMFRLSYQGDVIEVWYFECSKERGEVVKKKDNEDEDD